MPCTIPQVLPEKKREYTEYMEKYMKMAGDFTGQLDLPSSIDPSTLAYISKTSARFTEELQDSKIVKSYIKEQLGKEIEGASIEVDASKIIEDVFNYVTGSVAAAKITSTFGGVQSTTYTGKYAGKDVYFRVIVAVIMDDTSDFYKESAPKTVFELAYYAYLVLLPVKAN